MKMTKIWHWKMDYCKKNNLPPAQRWAWTMADEAYFKLYGEDEVMSETTKKQRPKHVGYSGQREFCRNNKHTYIEKFNGDPILMCNYPFPDIHHKKGVCRASTCTDMRELPPEATEEELAADFREINKDEVVSDAAGVEVKQEADHVDSTIMPSPSNE